jgi:hypothetical protein
MHEKISHVQLPHTNEHLISDMNLQVGDTFYHASTPCRYFHSGRPTTQLSIRLLLTSETYFKPTLYLSCERPKALLYRRYRLQCRLRMHGKTYSTEWVQLNCFSSDMFSIKITNIHCPATVTYGPKNHTYSAKWLPATKPRQWILYEKHRIRGFATIFDLKGRCYFSGELQPKY